VGRGSKKFYDDIDVKNLFNQWHRHIKTFTQNLNEDCALEVIKNCKIDTFETSKFSKVLNLTNTQNCQEIFDRISIEKNVDNFLNILEERDNLHPRDIRRWFTIKEIYESVVKNNYHPLLFLELYDKYYIIDGRTRLYCCLFLNIPAKVRIISDKKLNENCRK
tara:strand:- start:1117 stop:1605 length:489 start_codon:yes stop_codon:yes gene_type:complete